MSKGQGKQMDQICQAYNDLMHLKFLFQILFCALTLGGGQAQSAPTPFSFQDFLGVNAQFLWFQNCPQNPVHSSESRVDDLMEQVQALGLKHFRMDLHWDILEPKKGNDAFLKQCLDPVMQKARAHGLKPLLFLTGSAAHASSAQSGDAYPDQHPPRDPQDFALYLKKLAQRYPEVKHWQVWNEPNLPASWRSASTADTAQKYSELLQTSLKTLKNVPTEVMPAGMAYWSELPDGSFLLKRLLDSHALDGIQTVAYHPYSFTPEGLTAYSNDPQFFLNRTRTVNEALRKAGKSVWATEFGWSTYTGPIEEQPLITPEQQADFLLKRVLLSTQMGFDRIYLFTLTDLDGRASRRDQFYGLLDLQGQPKPAFTALKNLLKVLQGNLQSMDFPLQTTGTVQHQAWKLRNGQVVLTLWGDPQELNIKGQKLNLQTGRWNPSLEKAAVGNLLRVYLLQNP